MAISDETKPTARAAAKAARREQLLEVAKTLYARHGFEACAPFSDYTNDPASHFMTRML